jgi:DNA-binding response OmpR family regulator
MKVSTESGMFVLTKSERMLFKLLISAPGRCFSHDEIFAELRGEGYVGDTGALRILVKRLKNKLGREGFRLVNVRSYGYKFTE